MSDIKLVPVCPFSDFYIQKRFVVGWDPSDRFQPRFDPELLKSLKQITREEIESQFGSIEAQAIDADGRVFVWTTTHVVFTHFDGEYMDESLRAVPRHPPLPEDAERYHQATYQKWLRGLKEAREFPPTFAQYCRAEEVNPFTGEPWASNR